MSTIGVALHKSLLTLDLSGLSSQQVTIDISAEVNRVLFGLAMGKVVRELSPGVKLQPPSAAAPRNGFVDFAIVRGAEVVLVVEIDRSDKRFSLTKLEYFLNRGSQAIWIRWGRATQLDVPVGIELIEIPVKKRTR
jgi:hypothetical protein